MDAKWMAVFLRTLVHVCVCVCVRQTVDGHFMSEFPVHVSIDYQTFILCACKSKQ